MKRHADQPRVVITGLGPVSAIGVGREAFAEGLREARRGIVPLERFADSPDDALLGADLPDFDVQPFLKGRKTYLDPSSELALAAVALAVRDAGLEPADLHDAGLCFGSAHGPTETVGRFMDDLLQKGPRLVKPILFPHTYQNTAISLAAIEFDMRGPHLNVSAGFVSGIQAVAAGADLIRNGRTPVVAAGGYEALSEFLLWGYEAAGMLSLCDEANALGGPFGAERDGFVPASGAGVVILEDADHAQARGAAVYGELAPAGSAGGPDGLLNAMQAALHAAATPPSELSCILAAANGSIEDDHREAAAIRALGGRKNGTVPVAGLKALLGEPMGAGGALQLIGACLCLRNDFMPAAIALDCVDKSLGLTYAAASAGAGPHTCLINTLDPGGAVVSLAVRKEHAPS